MNHLPDPILAWYLFCLGLAVGVVLLAMAAYLTVSPRWLRWLLLASGVLAAGRYMTMALLAVSPHPQELRWAWRCWYGTSIGLTFPSLVALDQLVRHPAMTPRKLLQWYAPFLAAYLAVLVFGHMDIVRDPMVGNVVRLGGWALRLLAFTQAWFVLAFLGMAGLLLKKISSQPIQIALVFLLAAYAYLGLDGVLVTLGRWYLRPFLFSEIFALLAIWLALETADKHPA